MASWRTVRTGRQFVNLDYLGNKVLKDVLESVKPSQYNGKPQLIATLKNLQFNVAINSTSCELLEKAWGEEFESWVGKKVKVSKGKAKFGRSLVDAIIVSPDGK